MLDFWSTVGGRELSHVLISELPKNVKTTKELNENIVALTDAINKQNALLEAQTEMISQLLAERKVEKPEQMQTIKKSSDGKAHITDMSKILPSDAIK